MFGGFLAGLADLVQKEQAANILKIANVVETHLRITFPPLYAICLLLVTAGVLSVIFEAETKKEAFFRGASILAIVMTLVPNAPPDGVPRSGAEVTSNRVDKTTTLYHMFSARLVFARAVGSRIGSKPAKIELNLATDGGKSISDVTLTIQDDVTKQILARSKFSDKTILFYQPAGTYRLIVEVPGFDIVTERISVRAGDTLTKNLKLKTTTVPLFIQRTLRY